MKVLVITDLEGTAGVVSFDEQAASNGLYHEQAKQLATEEVNAAVEGFLAAGADDILVFDGHGCGGLRYECLHAKAKLLHGRPLPPRAVLDDVTDAYDVIAMVGQHAMAGIERANQSHTQDHVRIEYYKLNGIFIGEIAQAALYYGAAGLPLIFLSGDVFACREAEEVAPGVTTVSVKQGVGVGSAISLSTEDARKKIRQGTYEAMERHRKHPCTPLIWKPPFVLEKKFFHASDADMAADHPLAERIDSRIVCYRSDKIRRIIYL